MFILIHFVFASFPSNQKLNSLILVKVEIFFIDLILILMQKRFNVLQKDSIQTDIRGQKSEKGKGERKRKRTNTNRRRLLET